MRAVRPAARHVPAGPAATAREIERDDAALVRFDVFLSVAVGTVLVVRASLALLGYPQVGGSQLHVAHVLWGGLLMAVALIVVVMLSGSRAKMFAAFAGGIGFGLFIDEVGKFVSKDVDYFFRPAIAIMYATFVLMYLTVRTVVARRPLSDPRRVALGAQALADQALGQLDATGRARALRILADVGPGDLRDEAATLSTALAGAPPARPSLDSRLTALLEWIKDRLTAVLSTATLLRFVLILCTVQAGAALVAATVAVLGSSAKRHPLLDTGTPSLVGAILLVVGAIAVLTGRRRRGLVLLEWSTLINLLFTQLAVFNRDQWFGLVGFMVALLTLATLRLARTREGTSPDRGSGGGDDRAVDALEAHRVGGAERLGEQADP